MTKRQEKLGHSKNQSRQGGDKNLSHFFLPAALFSGLKEGHNLLTVDDQTAHQMLHVLRLEPGNSVKLLNGLGDIWLATVESVTRHSLTFSLSARQTNHTRKKHQITCILPLIKPARFEWALEKLTELNIDRIVPVATTRTVVKLKEDSATRQKRWQTIIKEAGEQCERLVLPDIEIATSISEALDNLTSKNLDISTVSLLLSERSQAPDMVRYLQKEIATEASQLGKSARIIIAGGPEGGFTDEEKSLFASKNFQSVSLGSTVLRSETAAIFAAGIASAIAETLD